MGIEQTVNVNISLSTAISADEAAFSRFLFLTDDNAVPLDVRYLLMTANNYTDYLTSGSEAYNFCGVYFAQANKPADIYIGRWAQAAQYSYTLFPNSNASNLIGGPADAEWKITDNAGTPTSEVFQADLSSTTTDAEMLAALQTEIRTGSTLTGAVSAIVSRDSLGRLTITNGALGGAGALQWTISDAGGAGTDITTSDYLDAATQVIIAGIDSEDPDAALTAIYAKTQSWRFTQAESSITDDQVKQMNTWCASKQRINTVLVTDTAAKSSGSTTDIAYELKQLNAAYSFGVYTEHAEDDGGNAIAGPIGNMGAKAPGSFDPANKDLTGVFLSGKDIFGVAEDLSETDKEVLTGKGCNYIHDFGGPVMTRSKTFGGFELRVLLGALYTSYRIQLGVANVMKATDAFTWSDDDIIKMEDVTVRWADDGVSKGFIDAGYVTNFPKASTYDSATKASGDYVNLEFLRATITSGIYTVTLVGRFTP